MNAERWQKVKLILEEALELSPELRSDFLEKACVGDENLRLEVENLLKFEEPESDLLEKEAATGILEKTLNSKNVINQQIGHYKVIEELGVGGMGAVFLAERSDGEFQQKVALKLIKRGMDSEAVLRRFITERQILASLEHPNIAHLIDGGTTDDGLPYFVMEYVEGIPIIEFAETTSLNLDERLDLFNEVCTAVSFAHQNLIIHRDLKPSNILVAKDGKVKLLDFGIAKVLNPQQETQTATQNFAFTPEYASPEQMRGEKLTTATDIYSLGAILYELLTGSRPYQTESKNISEIIKAVCETEPLAPSHAISDFGFRISDSKSFVQSIGDKNTNPVQQQTNPKSQIPNPKSLKGDLDNIILKSLRKEPERRYSSVEQFSEDIRRHQTGLPVTASADTWSYRASKFVQRNRIGVAAAALILVTLLGGLFATLYQRNKALNRFNDVRQLANSFLFEFHDAIENLPGSTPARELVVKRAIEYLDKLAAESEGDATLQRELGTAYERIGKIQGNSYFSNLGDTEGATKSYQKSLEIRQKLVDSDPTNLESQYNLARSHRGVGDILYTINDLEGGLQSYKNANAILENVVAKEPDNPIYLIVFTDVLSRLGDIKGMEGFANLGDTQGALESYSRVVEVTGKLVENDPENREYTVDYATRLIYLGKLQSATGDVKGTIESCQKSINIFEKLAVAEPDNVGYETRQLIASSVLRVAFLDEGREVEAIDNAQQSIERLKKLVAKDPKNVQLKRGLSVVYNSLGSALFQAKVYKSAIENHRLSLEIAEELSAADPKNGENKRDILISRRLLAEAQIETGEYDAALSNLIQNISVLEAMLKTDGSSKQIKDDLTTSLSLTGKVLSAKGNHTTAAQNYRRANLFALESLQKNNPNFRTKVRYAVSFFDAGKVFADLARTENNERIKQESCESFQRSFDIWNEMKQTGTLNKINTNRSDEVAKEILSCR